MATVDFITTGTNEGAFTLYEQEKKIGEMVVSIFGDYLTVYHTQVIPEAEGKGYAKQLLDAMVAYVRKNKLRVIPLCPYVLAQFKQNPDAYADIWKGPASTPLNRPPA